MRQCGRTYKFLAPLKLAGLVLFLTFYFNFEHLFRDLDVFNRSKDLQKRAWSTFLAILIGTLGFSKINFSRGTTSCGGHL